ncbi:hypothetical protein BH11BAC1_BH11BAC1_06480 [soil metagenome]
MKYIPVRNKQIFIYHITSKDFAKLFSWFLFSWLAQPVHAQDYVKTTKGIILNVHIVEVNLSELRYTNRNDSVVFSIPRSDVSAFKYGTSPGDKMPASIDYIPEEAGRKSVMYLKGIHDAEIYYTKYRAASNGTFWTTALVGLGPGLIPAFITTSISPTEENFGFPDSLLMKNPEYYKGYCVHAKAKKGKKVWHGYLGGIFVNIAFLVLLLSAGH